MCKRYDNPSTSLNMTKCSDGEYMKYEDALKFGRWCVEMAGAHGGAAYCRVRSEAIMRFPELREVGQ